MKEEKPGETSNWVGDKKKKKNREEEGDKQREISGKILI